MNLVSLVDNIKKGNFADFLKKELPEMVEHLCLGDTTLVFHGEDEKFKKFLEFFGVSPEQNKGYFIDDINNRIRLYDGENIVEAEFIEEETSEILELINEGVIEACPIYIYINTFDYFDILNLVCDCGFDAFTVKETVVNNYLVNGGVIIWEDNEPTEQGMKKLVCGECGKEYDFHYVKDIENNDVIVLVEGLKDDNKCDFYVA